MKYLYHFDKREADIVLRDDKIMRMYFLREEDRIFNIDETYLGEIDIYELNREMAKSFIQCKVDMEWMDIESASEDGAELLKEIGIEWEKE